MTRALIALALVAGAAALTLDATNFEEKTAGTQVFIKFVAPWCGHCQAMAPAWEKLMEEFKDSTNSVVAEMDCSDEKNEAVCSKYKVEGFPTIKWGETSAGLKDYEGEREFADMQKFAKENLGPTCGPKNLDLCNDEQKKQITDAQALSDTDLEAALKAHHDKLKALKEEYEKKEEKLQAEYELLKEERTKKVAEVEKGANPMMATICKEREKCTVPEKVTFENSDANFDMPPEGEGEEGSEGEEGEEGGEGDEGGEEDDKKEEL